MVCHVFRKQVTKSDFITKNLIFKQLMMCYLEFLNFSFGSQVETFVSLCPKQYANNKEHTLDPVLSYGVSPLNNIDTLDSFVSDHLAAITSSCNLLLGCPPLLALSILTLQLLVDLMECCFC